MPQTGLCTSLVCDREIKRLYECHCCSNHICLNHLLEHIELEKKDKDKFDQLVQLLTKMSNTINLNIIKKLKIIEKEKEILQRVDGVLDGQFHPVNQIENIIEEISQLDGLEEMIIKVESSLSNEIVSSPIFKSINSNNNQDEFPDGQQAQNVALDRIENSDQTKKIESIINFIGKCPLTFNGAFGLKKSSHSICLCSKKLNRQVNLYNHLINKHQLKSICAQRLVKAILKHQNASITKLFNYNEDVINHSYQIQCPFKSGISHLFNLNKKQLENIPCQSHSIITKDLINHLKQYHHVPQVLAIKLNSHLRNLS